MGRKIWKENARNLRNRLVLQNVVSFVVHDAKVDGGKRHRHLAPAREEEEEEEEEKEEETGERPLTFFFFFEKKKTLRGSGLMILSRSRASAMEASPCSGFRLALRVLAVHAAEPRCLRLKVFGLDRLTSANACSSVKLPSLT